MGADLFDHTSAVFSDCGRYRYRLDRIWNSRLPPLLFGMLNPSTADHVRNDATIERCQRRAFSLGFGSLIVWNLFAFRATDPSILKREPDPVGPRNDEFIRCALREGHRKGGLALIGWGAHGQLMGRNGQVLEMAREVGVALYCLGVTKGGDPKHPLYISYGAKPQSWDRD